MPQDRPVTEAFMPLSVEQIPTELKRSLANKVTKLETAVRLKH
ncbi:hypothetical protein [Nostoc sphaeroides]|uniref:Uncharacterized protein n=1 Tax=Nostoc sphaeroides CCNUC1 TaxID=2653204 RepID=A0A5P8WGM2_9NOSO|nr:hypothetical protein [Nostoc sphaeroides]QFS51760.1 hypothetical protein GXM_09254 [Nostoc sphaeroides CCNUC1]